MFKSKKLSKSKKIIRSLNSITSGAKLVFTKLKQAFVKTLILHHFNLERYIRIKTDASGYAISGIFSWLTSKNLGQWHPIAFFFQIIISAEDKYKTPNSKLLAIVKAFKT